MKTKEEQNEYHRLWQKKSEPGPGTIGIVPKLAIGHENLSTIMERGLERISKRVVPILKATEPQKVKKTTKVVNQGVVFGPVDSDPIDTENVVK